MGNQNTTIFLMRHSEPMKVSALNSNESIQINNEKKVLSINGEEKAKTKSNLEEFENLDKVYSSNYVRAISTAKYFANSNDLDLIVDENLGERKIGIKSWDEYPRDFEARQFADLNFKIGDGESVNEVSQRFYNVLIDIIETNRGGKVLVVCHATAIMAFLTRWCDINYGGKFYLKGVEFFDGKWDYLTTLKLTFDKQNKLIDIIEVKNK